MINSFKIGDIMSLAALDNKMTICEDFGISLFDNEEEFEEMLEIGSVYFSKFDDEEITEVTIHFDVVEFKEPAEDSLIKITQITF